MTATAKQKDGHYPRWTVLQRVVLSAARLRAFVRACLAFRARARSLMHITLVYRLPSTAFYPFT